MIKIGTISLAFCGYALKLFLVLFCVYFISCLVTFTVYSSFLCTPEGVVTVSKWDLFSGGWVRTHLHPFSFSFAVWDGAGCSVADHGGPVQELLAWIILCILEMLEKKSASWSFGIEKMSL